MTATRETCIILPIGPTAEDPQLSDLVTHGWFTQAITDRFGGATITAGRGTWRDPKHGQKQYNEPVLIYTVAMLDTEANAGYIEGLAIQAAADLKQEAVYVRHADGSVAILDVPNWKRIET